AALYPGLVVTSTIAAAAEWLAQTYRAPVMLLALLIGMACNFVHRDAHCRAGVEFASRSMLRFGIGLLGLRISLDALVSLGAMPLVIVSAAVSSTILIGPLLARALGLRREFGVLSGGSVAICGASAALAISATLPQDRELERDTILTIATVTALSTIAMI